MRPWIAIFAAGGVVAASLPFIRQHDDQLLALLSKAEIAVVGSADKPAKIVDPPALTDIDLTNMDDRREVVTAPAHGHRNADLTIDPVYQRAATAMLREGRVYEGSVVVTEVPTGKVLAWASHNQGRQRDLVVEANAPSASVFKIVTGAALIEANVSMSEKVCYRGGEQRVTRSELEPDPERDKYCATLPTALGRSLNVIFARLASQHLDADKLEGVAKRFGWGLDIPFDVKVAPSTIELPREDDLEFARSAAGFWHTTLSPFQATNLAMAVANKGQMLRSYIVDRVVDEDGDEIYKRPETPQVLRRSIDERTAWAVARMMEQTVRNGSGFKSFHDRAGRPYLPDIRVAGKTGTLEDKSTSTLHTWFVGFAPARDPQIAFSVHVANRGAWHVKAPQVACDMLRVYFADRGAEGVSYPDSYRGPKRRFVEAPDAGPGPMLGATATAKASASPAASDADDAPDDDQDRAPSVSAMRADGDEL